MYEETMIPEALQPQELEAVYAISSAVAHSGDLEAALDNIIQLTRPVFIFDNIVLYLKKNDDWLEPVYARLIGRGKSADGDVAWGETIAREVIDAERALIRQERLPQWEKNRLNFRLLLGIPIHSAEGVMGALIFGRFGGPAFLPEHVHLAEFVAVHVGQLLIRKQLIERVANLEAERRLQQLQEDFIASVSHELHTPLGFIKGYATTLLREDTDWDQKTSREFLTVIDEEADRLQQIIQDLLDSSRLQAGILHMQVQSVRLNELLEEICLKARVHYPGLEIQLNHTGLIKVVVDPLRISQVLDNLISNAVKYAPGSPLILTLEILENQCHIGFKDQGPGINGEHVEHLFEKFYRVPGKSMAVHGTGLGLFICRQIIRAHGGEITVESSEGEGTTFHIFLPNRQEIEGDK